MASEYLPLLPKQNNDTSDDAETWYSTCKTCLNSIKKILLLLCLASLLSAVFFYALFSPNGYFQSSSISFTPNTNNKWVEMENPSSSSSSSSSRQHLAIPQPWVEKQECEESSDFHIILALKQENIDLLDSHINDVSNPEKQETFHKYWNIDTVREYFSPSIESINIIQKWLNDNGFNEEDGSIQIISSYNQPHLIRVNLNCGQANQLLNTKYIEYENSETGAIHLRVSNGIYSVPQSVSDHIDYISPTIRFPLKKHTLSVTYVGSLIDIADIDLNTYNTPRKLQDLYQMTDVLDDIIGDNTVLDSDISRQAIGSFLAEYYDDNDLLLFWESLNVNIETEMERIPVTQPDGFGDEAELDTQYITSMGKGIYTYVYYIEGDGAIFAQWTESVINTDPLPLVISVSYGGDEYQMGEKWVKSSNNEFGKLALLGITVVASSGDSGALGEDEICYGESFLSFSGSGSSSFDDTTMDTTADVSYIPAFPASAPYVTSVGGTIGGTIRDSVDLNTDEEAWIASGGGFSIFFDQPTWQINAVNDYLNNDDISLPDDSRYISSNRAYPDISLQSTAYIIAVNGLFYAVSGTSASAPSVAGMISIINYARISAGKSSLGFLNPLLYSLYDDNKDLYFNDVSIGYNLGCEIDDNIGFYTAEGWDPVTGVGTPKFSTLFQALLDSD